MFENLSHISQYYLIMIIEAFIQGGGKFYIQLAEKWDFSPFKF